MRTKLRKLKERETQRLFATIFAGKMLGIATIFAAMKGFAWLFTQTAGAAEKESVATQLANHVSAINTAWVLVTAFLVFFMQAGFMALEAGFARSRESANILMECVFDTCLCGILYWAFGFALQFGSGNAIFGHQYFFLQNIPNTYNYGGLGPDTGVAFLAFFLFQFAFADAASTITSGAMTGRTSFKGDILYSAAVSGLIYPIFGHWVWGPGGWLSTTMGWFNGLVPDGVFFRDFAGSTVVHTVGGVIALMGAIVLGPRIGRKFKRDGGGPTPPHDLTMASIGAVILWFGWYGFNPGSTLSAMDFAGIGRVAANTTLAACAGGLVAVLFVYPRAKKWDLGMSLNGFLGGLVSITAPAYWVSPTYALLIGAIGGIVVPLSVDLLEHLRIDDPIGAVPVHMMAGIWGTLSIGLFADNVYGGPRGILDGGGGGQLVAQIIGSASALVAVGGVAFIVMKGISLIPGAWGLRVSRDGELEGLDIHEHGTPAYHVEFGYGMTYTAPPGGSGSGLPRDLVSTASTDDPSS